MLIPTSYLSLSSPFPFGNHKFVFNVCESFCFVKKFICIIFFLDSTYKWLYDIVFLRGAQLIKTHIMSPKYIICSVLGSGMNNDE